MLKIIDSFLNQITMYRLTLYYLVFIWLGALSISLFGLLPFGPLALIFSTVLILVICFVANTIFAKVLKIPTNVESVYITAFILVLLVLPIRSFDDTVFWLSAILTATLSIASKYILVIKDKHIFNPVAIGAVLTMLISGQAVDWWVGTNTLIPFVLIGGLLLTRKLIRTDLVLSFIAAALLIAPFSSLVLFFAFIMLTEPSTTPPRRSLRIAYGILVAILFSNPISIGNLYFTPELALVVGNLFSYFVGPKQRLVLKLKKKIQSSKDIIDFIFIPDQKLKFKAGQYMEWTVDPKGSDNRGNRRYLTIASSPTEEVIAIALRFPETKPSTFKQHLLNLKVGETITASQLGGDFVLPKYNKDGKNKKIVLIAGGIGITPYYSMVKSMIDRNEKRDVVLLYSNKFSTDAIYQFLWDEAKEKFGLRTIHAVTDKNDPKYTGRITPELIKKEIPDYLERYFYLSGPHALVVDFKETLISLGIKRSKIKTDFFPGFV